MNRLTTMSILIALLPVSVALGYEKAFRPTQNGSLEIKTIPSGRLIVSEGTGNYFETSNNLFMNLFRYIQRNDIKMTIPVEASIEPARMLFSVAPGEKFKANRSTAEVKVVDVPERTVLSFGGRGSYSEKNFLEGKQKLVTWLETNDEWQAAGEPFAVYWDGPATPWFLRSYEIQVEVSPTG